MSNKKITLEKVLPNGTQLIKTVKDWGDGTCTEQTKICKNLVVETVLFYMKADQRVADLIADGYEVKGSNV